MGTSVILIMKMGSQVYVHMSKVIKLHYLNTYDLVFQ